MEITEFLQEHWVSVFVASYLMGMMLYGHYRGFLRLSVSLAAVVLSFFVVRAAAPQAGVFVKENTGLHQWIREIMADPAGFDGLADEFILPAQQRIVIENSVLPETVKKALLENNNKEIYQILGVERFSDYVLSYLADRIANTLVFVVLFLAAYIGIRLAAHALDVIAKLPVLYGLNQIGGAILGLFLGVVYFWIFCLVLNLFIGTEWGRYLLDSMEASPWVAALSRYNLLPKLVMGIVGNLL